MGWRSSNAPSHCMLKKLDLSISLDDPSDSYILLQVLELVSKVSDLKKLRYI